MDTYRKDPQAVLDYEIDWSKWLTLAPGDAIDSATATAPPGLTVDHVTHDGKIVTVWLAAGIKGIDYKVTTHIVTVAGREDDWSILVEVRDR